MEEFAESDLNKKNLTLGAIQMVNLGRLCDSLNVLQAYYGKPFQITSGIRSVEEQALLSPRHPHDAHVEGTAVDLKDDGTIWKWCLGHMNLIQECGFYIENEPSDPGHLHLQITPPRSGKRVFYP